ncbi:MAG: hypothetical protein Q7R86_02800 [bacterium]|nr:hypothetical protein [bacterium]
MTGTLQIIIYILIGLNIAIFIFFCYSFYKGWQLRPPIGIGRKVKKTFTLRDAIFKERWNKIVKQFNPESAESSKLAIIDADKLVDDALKQIGLEGEHMADRLEQLSEDEVRSLPGIWRAHRLRNSIVHTPGFEVSPKTAEKAVEAYKSFLSEIGVLQEESAGKNPEY